MILVSAKKILIGIDLVDATILLYVNKIVNINCICQFPNLTFILPRILGYGLVRWADVSYKAIPLFGMGYC